MANILEKQCITLLYLKLSCQPHFQFVSNRCSQTGKSLPLAAKPRRCSGVVRRGSSQQTGGTKHSFIGCRPRSNRRLRLCEWRRSQLTADKIDAVRNIFILRGIRFLTTVPNFHRRGVSTGNGDSLRPSFSSFVR